MQSDTDVPSGRTTEPAARQFSVERQNLGFWHVVAPAVEADSALQAVIRSSSEAGTHRATPQGTYGLGEYFVVPEWGPPKPIVPPGSPPGGTLSVNGDG